MLLYYHPPALVRKEIHNQILLPTLACRILWTHECTTQHWYVRLKYSKSYIRHEDFFRPSSVTLRVSHQDSATGWTGELWSNRVLLILESKKNSFFLEDFFFSFFCKSNFLWLFKIFGIWDHFWQFSDIFLCFFVLIFCDKKYVLGIFLLLFTFFLFCFFGISF